MFSFRAVLTDIMRSFSAEDQGSLTIGLRFPNSQACEAVLTELKTFLSLHRSRRKSTYSYPQDTWFSVGREDPQVKSESFLQERRLKTNRFQVHYPSWSRLIKCLVYDEIRKELHIKFLDNTETYIYTSVPQNKFERFKTASSAGIFFNTNIRGKYNYYKQSEVE